MPGARAERQRFIQWPIRPLPGDRTAGAFVCADTGAAVIRRRMVLIRWLVG